MSGVGRICQYLLGKFTAASFISIDMGVLLGQWVKMKRLIVILLVVFVLALPAYGSEAIFCGVLIVINSTESMTVAWDPNPVEENVVNYKFRWREILKKMDYPWEDLGLVLQTTKQAPRTGTFIIELKAVNSAGLESEVTNSNLRDPAIVTEPWCVVVRPAAPGPIIIQ